MFHRIRWRSWGCRFLGFVALWTLIGLLFASQFHLSNAQLNSPVPWSRALGFALADWYVWAVWSVVIVRVARKFPLGRTFEWRHLALHVAASAMVSIGYVATRAWVGQWQGLWFGNERTFSQLFGPLLLKTWHFNLLIYWVILGATHAVIYRDQLRERELNAMDLEKRLATARLQALQMQLNPHFLFNTLNSIATLMHRDVDAADRMLVRLCELLRHALDGTGTQEVLLSTELTFLDRYLELEKIRFGDRLAVRREIGPESLGAMVPNLVLQPLVENAIKHGIEPRARPGEITLRAKRRENQLELEVSDNGGGMATAAPTREGIGLANTRARLRQLYGTDHHFEIVSTPGAGFLVRIRIPFRPEFGAFSTEKSLTYPRK